MAKNIFIQAASTLVLNSACETLKDLAGDHYIEQDKDYKDNMFMISMIGYAIATDTHKKEILSLFKKLIKIDDEKEIKKIIAKANHLINNNNI
tara:strand:- start:229 stop:507 length:279 start_codon:yes stop_codon:yes gene_type:complete